MHTQTRTQRCVPYTYSFTTKNGSSKDMTNTNNQIKYALKLNMSNDGPMMEYFVFYRIHSISFIYFELTGLFRNFSFDTETVECGCVCVCICIWRRKQWNGGPKKRKWIMFITANAKSTKWKINRHFDQTTNSLAEFRTQLMKFYFAKKLDAEGKNITQKFVTDTSFRLFRPRLSVHLVCVYISNLYEAVFPRFIYVNRI